MDASEIQKSFAYHRATPDVSIDEYVRRRDIELGEWTMARERVYLDKCFWIDLRDARINRTEDPLLHELLHGLIQGVTQGRRVCPISDVLFLELLKQSDPKTRVATAELIDELSCGVTLIPHPTRVETEVAHFFHANAGHEVYALEVLVWSKLSNVLGVQHPVASAFPVEEQLVIQKAFFDHMWGISLSQMIKTLDRAPPLEPLYPDLAARLNRGNTAHASQMKSFAKVYKDEIYGCLALAAPIAYEVLEKMAANAGGELAGTSPLNREAAVRNIHRFLCSEITKPPVKRALRTLHLGALLHAAVRWNRTQKIDANDLYDFHHVEAAVGYCNVFLVEGPMHTLLTQRHLGIGRDFPCHIISSRQKAAAWAR